MHNVSASFHAVMMMGLTVCVSNVVVTTNDLVARTVSAAEGRVGVVDTGINAKKRVLQWP